LTVFEKQRQTARPQNPSDRGKPAVIAPGTTFRSITDQITSIVLSKTVPPFWVWAFSFGIAALVMFVCAIGYLLAIGVGTFGINIPVAWGFAITNFVWWIGIGHAGTLISAILLLLNQSWRPKEYGTQPGIAGPGATSNAGTEPESR